MQEIQVSIPALNSDALHEDLHVALGEAYLAIKTLEPPIVVIMLADNATEADIEKAKTIAMAHDPSVLTPTQEAHQALQIMRAANSTPLNPADYKGESPLVRALAEKIAWLEREIGAQGRG